MKAAIFDLDGTLIDSMSVWDKIGRDFLVARGITAPDDLSRIVKNFSFSETADYYIRRFGLTEPGEQLVKTWNEMAYREYAQNIAIKPGVVAYLKKLHQRNVKIGIATATERTLTEAVLRRHHILDFFETIVTIADIGKGKEYPDIFLAVARELKTDPPECTVFEDSVHAVKGAKLAGMKVWAVYDPASEHEKAEMNRIADGYIYSFTELG
jgi:HAD superfamily hydrolase (TIGR01509 family)